MHANKMNCDKMHINTKFSQLNILNNSSKSVILLTILVAFWSILLNSSVNVFNHRNTCSGQREIFFMKLVNTSSPCLTVAFSYSSRVAPPLSQLKKVKKLR